jgi:hypothetical protein
MWLSNDLKSCDDKTQFKVRDFLLHMVHYLLDDLELIFKSNRLSIVIEEHANDVSQFNHEDVLSDALSEDLVEEFLEEFMVLSQV